MKTIIINASPRKEFTTYEILKSAKKGAESVGSDTEYIDLYDLENKGCVSCLICKMKDMERCKCYLKDDYSELIEKILNADVLLIGSPIYLGDITSHLRALLERLIFCILSYDDAQSYFKGKINVGLFFTMNAVKDHYNNAMAKELEKYNGIFSMLNGKVEIYPVCNTVQVDDYSRYNMGMFDSEAKKENREKQFPIDLDNAFKIGAKLSDK